MNMMNIMLKDFEAQADIVVAKPNSSTAQGLESTFAKLLLKTVNNNTSNITNDMSDTSSLELNNLIALESFLKDLTNEELSMLYLLLQHLMEPINNDSLIDEFSEKELTAIKEQFTSIENFLAKTQQITLSILQNNINDNRRLPINVATLYNSSTNNLQNIFNSDLNIDETKADNFLLKVKDATINDSFARNNDAIKEMINVLKRLLASFEQKDLQTGNIDRQVVSNAQHMLAEVNIRHNASSNQTAVKNAETVESSQSNGLIVDNETKANLNDQQTADKDNRNNVFSERVSLSNADVISKEQHSMFQTTIDAKVQPNQSTVNSEVKLSYTNAGDFQKQIEELVVNQAKLVKKPNGQQSMIINLHPASLGSIKILVTSNQGQITTNITTDTIATKELLENSINNLRLALMNTGVQIERIDIQQQNNNHQSVQHTAGAQLSQFNQQKRNAEQHEEQQNKKNKSSGSFTVEELEELALDFIDENHLDRKFYNLDDTGRLVNITA